MCYGLYKTLKTDYREERREMQEALAYDRDAERRQLEEIKAGQPSRLRRVRVPQATAGQPTSDSSDLRVSQATADRPTSYGSE
jgi:hypothetical protein